jgi:UV DNA damage endonuclease
MIRLGLCCIFSSEPIKFRTTTATYLQRIDHPYEYLSEIISHNLDSLKAALEYCVGAGIGCFRLSSQFFPLCSHPDWKYQLSHIPRYDELRKKVENCRSYKDAHGLRLTLHPDQFVVLNSPRPEVVQSAIRELEYHAHLAGLIGIDVINIHGGGVYGDKVEALERFQEHYKTLPPQIQSRLTLENDDKCYTPQDLLPLCEKNQIPFVYDVHHHRCLKDELTIEQATRGALSSWNREPLFHISSPKEGWAGPKPQRHHDYIAIEDFPVEWESLEGVTIEVEAKAKELAVKKLKKDLILRGISIRP